MLFVRYHKKGKIIDKEVSFENAHCVYRKMKQLYKHADLIMIDEDGLEYCVC